jgi:hypothetical protein
LSRFLAAASALASSIAAAHPGHGASAASHWHSTDVLGFVLAGLAATAIVWFTRGKK